MARKATGAQTGLAYVSETNWGVTPASPTMKELRAKEDGVDSTKGNLRSETIKFNRMINDVIHGTHGVEGTVPCEFGDYIDDWIESAMFGRFASGVIKVAQTRRSFTLERRLHSLHQSMRYTGIVANGFDLAMEREAIAQITFPIVGKTMTTDPDALGGPIDWLINEPVTPPAPTDTTFDIDGGTGDPAAGDTFMVYKTTLPNELRSEQIYTVVSFAAGALTFSPGLDVALVDNDILHFIRPATVVTANEPMNAFSGVVTEGGSSIAIATRIALQLRQGLEAATVIGSNFPTDVTEAAVTLTGTLNAYVENLALFNKFVAEAYGTLEFQLVGTAATYTFLMPKIKYIGARLNKPLGGTSIIKEMPFEAVYDGTEDTVLKITKT